MDKGPGVQFSIRPIDHHSSSHSPWSAMLQIGPSRPRNDRDDPNRNDTGVFNWLGKRGMNINEFNKLVEVLLLLLLLLYWIDTNRKEGIYPREKKPELVLFLLLLHPISFFYINFKHQLLGHFLRPYLKTRSCDGSAHTSDPSPIFAGN